MQGVIASDEVIQANESQTYSEIIANKLQPIEYTALLIYYCVTQPI